MTKVAFIINKTKKNKPTNLIELLDQNKKDSEQINETQNEIHHLKE